MYEANCDVAVMPSSNSPSTAKAIYTNNEHQFQQYYEHSNLNTNNMHHQQHNNHPNYQMGNQDLTCYAYTGQTTDCLDINSLEPSLWSQQPCMPPPAQSQWQGANQQQSYITHHNHNYMQQQPQHNMHQLHHNSPTASSHTSTGSEDTDDMYNWHPYKRSSPNTPQQHYQQFNPQNIKQENGAPMQYQQMGVYENNVAMPNMSVDSSQSNTLNSSPTSAAPTTVAKRTTNKAPKKRKPRKDPNEPTKPVSAYALFFRDTQAAIKGQNPNASFGEVSKIVASMWDNLDPDSKSQYKQRTETEKKEYLKKLAAYRASLLSKNGVNGDSTLQAQQEFMAAASANRLFKSEGSSPDSTTCLAGTEPAMNQQARSEPPKLADFGARTLASLIAEPRPQQVLTATTTLTVPQNYIPMRTRQEMEGAEYDTSCVNNFNQRQQLQPNEALAQHCRDVYSIWGQPHQSNLAPSSAAQGFAPV